MHSGLSRYRLDDPVGARIFTSSCYAASCVAIQPSVQRVLGDLSPGVKRLEREADRPPPTGAEVKKTWVYTSTHTYAFMA
jgi:hypothetical protein